MSRSCHQCCVRQLFPSPDTIAQGLRKEERLSKAEVKAWQMQPAFRAPLMEQASLPMIRGKALL